MLLQSVAVLIKTFLRDLYLRETIDALTSLYPEVQMIVVDDSDNIRDKAALYDNLRRNGHVVRCVPFDSGFGFKSNTGIRACERPYLLVGSDDFNFRLPFVRPGLERMASFLDDEPEYAIAGGDVVGGGHSGHYEFDLFDYGSRVIESPIRRDRTKQTKNGVIYLDCDLTRNYCLVRREILGWAEKQVHWDDDVKIGGGEHGAFFTDVKRAGHRVAFLPDSQISEQTGKPMDPRYPTMRGRARRPQRECFEHRGILEWIHVNPDGTQGWDYDARPK